MKIGKILRNLRIAAGLTQEELAKKVKLSKSNISKYESDDMEPNLTTLEMFANIFGVSINTLFGLTDEDVIVYPSNEKDSSTDDMELSEDIKKYVSIMKDLPEKDREAIYQLIDFYSSRND